VELVREDAVSADEQGARALLRTLALFALGDTPTSLAVSLRQAATPSTPPAALWVVIGATRALEGNDRDAIAAWQSAISTGLDAAIVSRLLIDAYLRLGDSAHAIEVASSGVERQPGDAILVRRLAAGHIAANHLEDAVRLLDGHLRTVPDDVEAQWLLLHALYTGAARAQGPGADQAGRDRIKDVATRYTQAGGKNASLAAEWAASVK
jgi:predicted Zn-dependent protease